MTSRSDRKRLERAEARRRVAAELARIATLQNELRLAQERYHQAVAHLARAAVATEPAVHGGNGNGAAYTNGNGNPYRNGNGNGDSYTTGNGNGSAYTTANGNGHGNGQALVEDVASSVPNGNGHHAAPARDSAVRVSLHSARFGELRGLGLSATQANRILRYRKAGDLPSITALNEVPGIPDTQLRELKLRLTE